MIFDCDGVLVDSEPLSNRILVDLLAESGWRLTLEESRARFMGRRMDDVIAETERHLGRPLQPDWLKEFEARRNEAFRQHLKPIPGAAEAVAAITAAGVATCVASSGSVAKMRLTLGLTGLAQFFGDRLYTSWDLPRGKPFPDIFLHAAAAMTTPAADCVVVEDSAPGVHAAVAAGMRCLAFAAAGDALALAAKGGECFTAMADLPALLGLSKLGSE